MISDALTDVVWPQVRKIQGNVEDLAIRYADLPMLARTHGQPASPTTFGKEFNVYNTRIKRQIEQLRDRTLQAKLNGATGNYNAHSVACPEVSWINFTKSFIERLNTGRVVKLEPNFVTTQIEPHDSYAELFDNLRRTNNVLIDFDRDMWRYISDGWIVQKTVEGEVGSSIMPHKVNPINFENSEKNLIIANHWLDLFSNELTKSRLQRDLTDATLKRNIGVAFGHILVAYGALEKGLGKIEVNRKKVLDEVKSRPEVLAEAVQTILRREGVANPYEKLKELTRGKEVTLYVLAEFVDGLDIGPEVKSRIKSLTPESYLGLAEELAKL